MSVATIRYVLDKYIAANKAYRAGAGIISDAEYDALEDQLVSLVANADPSFLEVREAQAFLDAIGDAPVDDGGWNKVTHLVQMTSLNKCQLLADVHAWLKNCGAMFKGPWIVSDKCDGISISLHYTNGTLTRAVTRGDGDEGQDITRNVVKMKGIVHNIKGLTGDIRGEIVLKKSDWMKHFPTYSNPRNAAAGIATNQDGLGCQHLTVLHYQLLREVTSENKPLTKKEHEFLILQKIGCAVPNFKVFNTMAEVEVYYQEYIKTIRESLDYLIDGLVIEFNELATMETLGDLNKRPRGAIAYKFPHDSKSSKLNAVRWQVGKSGRITPVAEFDSVSLAGVNVRQASLHNVSKIMEMARKAGVKHLTVGDMVLVSRRNDVIPYVEKVVTPNLTGTPLLPPDHCPACNELLIMDGEYLLCRGEDCPAQVLGAISRWVKKIGVLGIGDSLIEALIDHAGVTDAADLYVLDPAKIENIPSGSGGSRIGRTAYTLMDELKSKSEVPLHIFVGSVGIENCSRSVCKTIVDAGFNTLEKMQDATLAQIAAIPGLGSSKAQNFVTGIKAKQTLLDKLQDNGVTIKALSVGALSGLSVCCTGFRSPDLEKAIENAGGTMKSSVGKGLTYLVSKDPTSGSEKLKKAAALGVKVVGIDDVWALLGGQPTGGAAPVKPSSPFAPKAKPAPVATPAAGILDLFGEEE